MTRFHVSHKEASRAIGFMCEVTGLLNLPPYSFHLLEEPCEPEAEASIEVIEGRLAAKLRLSRGWMDVDEHEKMRTLCHEACHLLHRGVDHVVDLASTSMGTYEHIRLRDEVTYHHELMVDHVANLMSVSDTVREAWLKPPE